MIKNLHTELVRKYTEVGPDKFYKFLLSSAILKLVVQIENIEKIDKFPHVELLECHDKFMVYYRREGKEVHLEIALLCRRAAHKIYRELRKKKLVAYNNKFLNLVGE